MAALGFADSSNKKGTTPGLSKLKGLDSNLTTPSGTPASSRASSPLAKIPAAKRVNVLEEYAKRSTDKPKMNLVVIGKLPILSLYLCSLFLSPLYGRPCGRWEIHLDGPFLV
jgi:elongation factor 1 alpha-like protein